MEKGAWWATVHGVAKESDMTEQLTLSLALSSSITMSLTASQMVKDFADVTCANSNKYDFFIMYSKMCQYLESLHTPVKQYFPNDL